MQTTSLNIEGGILPLVFLVLTMLLRLIQDTLNQDVWSTEYKTRLCKVQKAEGRYALICATISTIILIIEVYERGEKTMIILVRSLAVIYVMSAGFLFNKILHSANYLATCKRVIPGKEKEPEYTFMNLSGWRIPFLLPKKSKSGGNLRDVQRGTANAIRTIHAIWFSLFILVVPTTELWLNKNQIGLVFGPFRIL